MFCKYCGKDIDDNSKFCQYCGKALDESSTKRMFKLPHINKWVGYIYGIWVAVNAFFIILGGTTRNCKEVLFPSKIEYSYDIFDPFSSPTCITDDNWAFDFAYYDYTDFFVYAFIVPFILFILYKLISELFKTIYRKRKKKKKQKCQKPEVEYDPKLDIHLSDKEKDTNKSQKKNKFTLWLFIAIFGLATFFGYMAFHSNQENQAKQEQSIQKKKKSGEVVYDEVRDFSDDKNEQTE